MKEGKENKGGKRGEIEAVWEGKEERKERICGELKNEGK